MAENITGMESSSWGSRRQSRRPSLSRVREAGFFPRNTRVSMGSRRGSMEGLVTWEALSSSRSQYTGRGLGLPMEESSTPPLPA